jgi:hypothetical protein
VVMVTERSWHDERPHGGKGDGAPYLPCSVESKAAGEGRPRPRCACPDVSKGSDVSRERVGLMRGGRQGVVG